MKFESYMDKNLQNAIPANGIDENVCVRTFDRQLAVKM